MRKKERVGEEKEGKRKGRRRKINSKDKEQRHGKMKIAPRG